MGHIVTASGIKDPQRLDWCSPLWMTDGAHQAFKERQGRSGITLDPCANRGSLARVRAEKAYMLPETDGLKESWACDSDVPEGIWVNPPFGRYWIHPTTKHVITAHALKLAVADLEKIGLTKEAAKSKILEGYETKSIANWTAHLAIASKINADGILICPAATGTSWWHGDIEESAAAFILLRGRPKFELVDPDTGEVVSKGDAAPMDCALICFSQDEEFVEIFKNVFRKRGAFHKMRY